MEIKNKALKRRIIDISYRNKLSHLGSCLTAVDIIKEIYDQKKPDEKFILSSGHAGLALYVVIEAYGGRNAEDIFAHHGVHPDRCTSCGLDCSTGSLGQGLPIAVGMALADRSKSVWCLISDGECAEGSIYEAMNVINDRHLLFVNLHVYINANGWAAYRKTYVPDHFSETPMVNLVYTDVDYIPFLKGQDAHYYVMNEDDYKLAMEILK